MDKIKTIKLNFEEWEEKYKPIKNHFVEYTPYNDYMFETHGKELEHVKKQGLNNIWTLLDCEDETSYICSGYSIVNRNGYFITEIPFNDNEYVEVDDNNYLDVDELIEESVNFCYENIDLKELPIHFTEDYNNYFKNLFKDDKVIISVAKYTLLTYLNEELDIELSSKQEDLLHDWFSNLN